MSAVLYDKDIILFGFGDIMCEHVVLCYSHWNDFSILK